MDADVWLPDYGVKLARARRQRGETQAACAIALKRLGAQTASQGSVSNWEQGRTKPGDARTISAIGRYCSSASLQEEADAPKGRLLDDDDDFQAVVADLTGAPVLSGRQARLLDALITRLETGVPLSSADADVARMLMRTLRLLRP